VLTVKLILSDGLPAALEQVTRLGLKKLAKVLRVPPDIRDDNLVRSQVTAEIGAINAQLRADEQLRRRKTTGDVLQRLIKITEEEKKKLPWRPWSLRRHRWLPGHPRHYRHSAADRCRASTQKSLP
jgi:hypothetical protein